MTPNTAYNYLLSIKYSIACVKKKHGADVLVISEINGCFHSLNEDAEKINDCLGLTIDDYNQHKITAFDCKMVDEYLPKLVRAGHRVAMYHPVK